MKNVQLTINQTSLNEYSPNPVLEQKMIGGGAHNEDRNSTDI